MPCTSRLPPIHHGHPKPLTMNPAMTAMTAIPPHAPNDKGSLQRTIALGLVLLCGVLSSPAKADSQLATEKGCMNCHGTAAAARKHMPSFTQLAAEQARYQSQVGADQKLADKLREHKLFGGISAHETLSPESALALARWVIGGAK